MSDRVERSSDTPTPTSPFDAGALLAEKNLLVKVTPPADTVNSVFGNLTLHSLAQAPGEDFNSQYQHNGSNPELPTHSGKSQTPPEDPALPGLPPPSRGHRQIIHLQPGRYIEVPYPTDYSINKGISYGHVTIQVPSWMPGGHPYRR